MSHAVPGTARDSRRTVEGFRRAGDRDFSAAGNRIPGRFSRGVIVGTVDVAEIVDQEEYLARYGKNPADRLMAFGPLCWILKNPRPCRPIPCAGALSLWNAAKL